MRSAHRPRPCDRRWPFRRGAGCAALVGLASVTLAWPAQAGAAPRRGDWELTGSRAARGSFAVVVVRQRRKHHRAQRRLEVENLVVDAPVRCANSPNPPAPFDVNVVGAAIPISSSGSFRAGKIRKGNGTVLSASFRRGRFRLSYRHVSTTRNLFTGGNEVCDTKLVRLMARPGHRRLVRNGTWTGQTAIGQAIEFNVVADGRALAAPSRPRGGFSFQVKARGVGDLCPYGLPDTLFVAADGTFGNSDILFGDQPVIAGRFTGARHASGQFTNSAQGCAQADWSAGPA